MSPDRLKDLIHRSLDEQLDREELQDLAAELDRDDAARRAYVRAADQHQALRRILRPAVSSRRSIAPWALAAAAAAGLLVAVLAIAFRPKEPVAVEVVREPERPIRPPEPLPPPPIPAPRPEPPPPPKEPVRTAPPVVVPEKPPAPPPPVAPEPPKPEPPKPVAPPAPPKGTATAVAVLESLRGEVHSVSEGGRRPLKAGQALLAGQEIETGAGESVAILAFPDQTRLELRPQTALGEISVAPGKRVVLRQGTIVADVAKQPAGQPMILATRHAEALVVGTRLSLACGEATRLEVKDGRVRFTRLEDKRAVDVAGGQHSVAARGVDLAPRRTTRGPMMAGAALWGEDFQEAGEIDRDWMAQRNGLEVSTSGQFDVDLAGGGDASLGTRASYAPPFRVSADVEFTQRLKGTLVALRLQSWKEGKALVHADLDEDRYYLRVGDQTVTADATRRSPRRERWTIEVGADGAVSLLVDGKGVLKAGPAAAREEFHVTLLAKAQRDAPARAHVRFDNLVLERTR